MQWESRLSVCWANAPEQQSKQQQKSAADAHSFFKCNDARNEEFHAFSHTRNTCSFIWFIIFSVTSPKNGLGNASATGKGKRFLDVAGTFLINEMGFSMQKVFNSWIPILLCTKMSSSHIDSILYRHIISILLNYRSIDFNNFQCSIKSSI